MSHDTHAGHGLGLAQAAGPGPSRRSHGGRVVWASIHFGSVWTIHVLENVSFKFFKWIGGVSHSTAWRF